MKKFMVLFVLIFSVLFVFADDDANACEYARKAHSEKVWRLYLKKFPNGACSFEAESELASAEEQEEKAEPAEQPEAKPSLAPAYNTEPEQTEMKPAEEPAPAKNAQPVSQKPRKFKPYPYRPWGTALMLVGSLSIGVMSYTAYTARIFERDNDYHPWAGWTTASVAFGVLGGGLLATGTALLFIKRKPPENCNVSLNNLSVAPTKDGMFASAGFSF